MTNVSSKFNFKPIVAALLLSLTVILLAACGDNTPVPASNPTGAATTSASTTAAATVAPTTVTATTPAATTAAATTAATTPGATGGAAATPGAAGSAAAKAKQLDTAKGTVESFDSSSSTLTVKESNGQTEDFNVSKTNISQTQKISLTDFAGLSLTGKTVEFSGQKGSDGSYTPKALTILDQPVMTSTAKAGKTAAAKNKKQSGTPAANPTPQATAGAVDSNRVVLNNATVSGNTLTGTGASGETITVNLSASTTINQRVTDKPTDLTSGENLTINYRTQGKKATGPANAVSITVEK